MILCLDLGYPDISAGLRDTDAHYWSSTFHFGTTMNGNVTASGVGFGDGRIKGYGKDGGPGVHACGGGGDSTRNEGARTQRGHGQHRGIGTTDRLRRRYERNRRESAEPAVASGI